MKVIGRSHAPQSDIKISFEHFALKAFNVSNILSSEHLLLEITNTRRQQYRMLKIFNKNIFSKRKKRRGKSVPSHRSFVLKRSFRFHFFFPFLFNVGKWARRQTNGFHCLLKDRLLFIVALVLLHVVTYTMA